MDADVTADKALQLMTEYFDGDKLTIQLLKSDNGVHQVRPRRLTFMRMLALQHWNYRHKRLPRVTEWHNGPHGLHDYQDDDDVAVQKLEHSRRL